MIVKVQMKLAKVPKRMRIRMKALKTVEEIHEITSNKSDDFVQKVSLILMKTYNLISFTISMLNV